MHFWCVHDLDINVVVTFCSLMLSDLSICFSWLCFKLSLKFCKWIYFFIAVHCKHAWAFQHVVYKGNHLNTKPLSAWIEPWGSLTWLKCCALMMKRTVLGVVWEKFLYSENVKREIVLFLIQQLRFPFFFLLFLRDSSCGFVFLPTHKSIVRHISVPRQHLLKWVIYFRVGQLQEASHQLNWTCRVKE